MRSPRSLASSAAVQSTRVCGLIPPRRGSCGLCSGGGKVDQQILSGNWIVCMAPRRYPSEGMTLTPALRTRHPTLAVIGWAVAAAFIGSGIIASRYILRVQEPMDFAFLVGGALVSAVLSLHICIPTAIAVNELSSRGSDTVRLLVFVTLIGTGFNLVAQAIHPVDGGFIGFCCITSGFSGLVSIFTQRLPDPVRILLAAAAGIVLSLTPPFDVLPRGKLFLWQLCVLQPFVACQIAGVPPIALGALIPSLRSLLDRGSASPKAHGKTPAEPYYSTDG